MAPREKHTHYSPTPPWAVQSSGRCGVTHNEGPHRLEPEPSPVPEDRPTIQPNRSRSVCIQNHSTVPSLLQLAARSLCSRDRCIPSGLVTQKGVCESPMVSNRQSPSTDSDPTGSGDTSCLSMENANMVPITPDNVSRPSTSGTADNMDDNQAGRTNAKSSTSRVAYLRQGYRDKELSEEATSLLLRSRRLKTNKSYHSLFHKWHNWCDRRHTDPFSGPVSEVVNFLAHLFMEGYSYNSLNSYRSAISSAHDQVEGYTVGQHPLVTRLLKGAFNDRPPLPKYTSTWEVQVVLDYLQLLGENESLSLKQLTWKTVMLLALTRPSR